MIMGIGSQAVSPRQRVLRPLVSLQYILLLILFVYTSFFLGAEFGPEGIAAKLVLLLMKTSGLLLVLPGILLAKTRSYLWLCFILLMYFLVFVLKLFSVTAAWYDYLGLALVVSLFVTSMMAARWSAAPLS